MRHSMLPGSIARLAAGLVVGAAAAAPCAAQNAGAPDYGAYTAARLIPFIRPLQPTPLPFTHTVGLRFHVGGQPVEGTMDTGTTGVILSPHQIPGYRREDAEGYPLGWEFLSSSRVLWVGRWIPQDLVFVDALGRPLATAHVPVLAVETEVKCVKYKEGPGGYGPVCPDSARVVVGRDTVRYCRGLAPGSPCLYPIGPPSSGLAYVGVGFGREYDGQPQGLPDRNPLLNITMIEGEPVQPGTLRSGYIITAEGVHVGLTPANTAGFAFTRLQPRMIPVFSGGSLVPGDSTASPYPRDWGAATVCVSVDGAPCAAGKVLVDTGVDEMFLTVPTGMPFTQVVVHDPSMDCDTVRGLADGSRVSVSFPGTGDPPTSYSFVVGDTLNPTAPSVVMASHAPDRTFVNTGRHFLRAFDVLLDADGGWFGVRPVSPGPRQGAGAPAACRPTAARAGGAPRHAPHVRRDEGFQERVQASGFLRQALTS